MEELENDELERGEVEKTIKRLLVDKEGNEMRESAKNLKERVELGIKEGGSPNNSLNELLPMSIHFNEIDDLIKSSFYFYYYY